MFLNCCQLLPSLYKPARCELQGKHRLLPMGHPSPTSYLPIPYIKLNTTPSLKGKKGKRGRKVQPSGKKLILQIQGQGTRTVFLFLFYTLQKMEPLINQSHPILQTNPPDTAILINLSVIKIWAVSRPRENRMGNEIYLKKNPINQLFKYGQTKNHIAKNRKM